MAVVVLDPSEEARILKVREELDGSRYDEVWERVHVIPPLPNDEQQEIVGGLSGILLIAVQWTGLGEARAGINLSDRVDGWEKNYREPDVVVFLRETTARNLGTHWVGGPDFAVEILSPGDWTRRKIPFYAQLATRELLLIDRDPWALELYRLREGMLELVGRSTPDQSEPIGSAVLPLTFRLNAGEARPMIEVTHTDGVQRWMV